MHHIIPQNNKQIKQILQNPNEPRHNKSIVGATIKGKILCIVVLFKNKNQLVISVNKPNDISHHQATSVLALT